MWYFNKDVFLEFLYPHFFVSILKDNACSRVPSFACLGLHNGTKEDSGLCQLPRTL